MYISSDILLDLLKGHQHSLPMYIPEFQLKEEHCVSLSDEVTCTKTETGSSYSSKGQVDHPSFTRLRLHLEAKGLLFVERGWVNGDRVLKKFKVNGVLFQPGEKFFCSAAMHWHLFRRGK